MTIEVSSWTDLDAIRDDLTEDYVLTTDLDSTDGDYAGIGDDWTPIGDLFSTDWTLDGQGHEIRDLVISDTDQSVGLCRGVGEIRNLGVVDADVNNPNSLSDRQSTGILIGSTGGGPTIENCYSSGSVDAAEEDVGGLIGTMTSSGTTVRSCFSSATVTTDNGFCGGLVGLVFNGTVQSCYTLGSVASPSVKGGFVGENNGEIRECWSATSLTGGGGFVGLSFGDEIGCFWDSDVGPDTTDGDATGLTTSEMQGLGVETTMPPLRYVADFSRAVGGDNADADGYPILRSVPIAPQDDAQTASIADYRAVVRDLTAAGVDDDGPAVGLSWSDRAAGEDLFRVYRTDGDGGVFPDEFVAVAETDAETETATDSDLPDDTTFTYRVVAVEDSVESDPTDADTVTTPTGEFVVEIVGTNSPVGVGETLELDVDVTNQGGASGETTVEADLTEQ